MYSAYFKSGNVSRTVISSFGGINRRARIGDGEFADMQNMSADAYPLLAPRAARTVAQRQLTETKTETTTGESGTEQTVETTVYKSLNGILGDVGFCAVWGTDFYYLGQKIEGLSLIDGEKRLAAFGANIIIYPDQKYYNTVTGESGAMETAETVSGIETILTKNFKYKASDSRISTDANGNVYISVNYIMGRGGFTLKSALCRTAKDSVYGPTPYTDGEAATEDSFTKFLRIRIQNGTIEYISSATTVHFSETDMGFRTYKLENIVWETLPVEAVTAPELTGETGYLWNGDTPIKITDGMLYMAEPGDLSSVFSSIGNTSTGALACAYNWTKSNLPRLDHVCVLDNRLWGCRYGMQAGSTAAVNEIYCSKLGDFKNFTTGTTADAAWSASVGAYGKWTGCIALGGRVLFFKEDKMLRVSGTKPANFQIAEIADVGLQSGCEKSMQIIDGVLYYKSRDGIYTYDGSLPTRISDKLGDAQRAETAVAGSIYGKYYVALDGVLYVYDTYTGLWHKEDRQNIRFFTRYGGSLYAAVDQDIVCLAGEVGTIFAAAEPEGTFAWSCESGDLGLDSPYQKYYKNVLICVNGDVSADMTVSVIPDDGEPIAADFTFDGLATVVFPIVTPRCNHMRVKISGHGAVRINSLWYETETVSDTPERR